jgi:delta 1-pyrroline-5-carboxylate dehydrogenase
VNPDFLLRLVTEKTRTINTTATGGNAALLELGSSAV